MIITGTFDVKLNPIEPNPAAPPAQGVDGITLGHFALDKQFHGALSAHSRGQMLSAMTPVKGSAGYVAIEQVVGSVSGRTGSFVLQHYGVMHSGTQALTLEVVPDSATGQLLGLRGSMSIVIESGQHHYTFDYTLPPA